MAAYSENLPMANPRRETAQQDRLTQWYKGHCRAFLTSFNELLAKPLANLMTLMVIGIAVALPFGLYTLLQNLQEISRHWDNSASISLYLKKGTPDFQITDMLQNLRKNPDIETVKYISPEQGLRDFQRTTQFGDILSELKQNPLPGVVLITPPAAKQTPKILKNLLAQQQDSPLVETGQIDLAWIKRLYFFITIGQRITYSLVFLFGLGVLLIIGNTIRLTLEHYQDEMMILKLVGATDAFIRRPLLYRGLLYGFFGGILAWLLVAITLWWLKAPAQALASSYSQNLLLQGLPIASGVLILIFSASLGISGAWLATRRQLRCLS
jgi:cell division transport system permease protein